MADEEKGKAQTQIVPARERKKAPRGWQLTEYDKRFLRDMNIRPE